MKSLKLFFSFLVFGIFYFSTAQSTQATTYYAAPGATGVGTYVDPASIFHAVAISTNGDVVRLKNGGYTIATPLVINKKIQVKALNMNMATFNCTYSDYCVKITPNLGTEVTFSGVNLSGYWKGILVSSNSSPDLSHLNFDNHYGSTYLDYYAIHVNGTGASPSIHNNNFTYTPYVGTTNYWDVDTGVYIELGDADITANTFEHETLGIQAYDGESTITIADNVFDDNYWGIASYGEVADNAFDIHTNSFSRLSFFDRSGAIWLEDVAESTVADNQISDSDSGIRVRSVDSDSLVTISGNTISNTYNNGISVLGTSSTNKSIVTISSNTMSDADACIQVVADVEARVEKNFVSNCDLGIESFGEGVNSISEVTYTVDHSPINTIINNLIEGSTTASIQSAYSINTIAYNTLVNGDAAGFYGETYDVSTLYDNIIYGHGFDAFLVDTTSTLYLGYNDSYGNGSNYATTFTDLGGNISVDPSFLAIDDFHLNATSALRNAGGNLYAVLDDIENNIRDISGYGYAPEMGAYEYTH